MIIRNVIHATVAYSAPCTLESIHRQPEVVELTKNVIFCLRDYEHLYKESLRKDETAVICDSIEIAVLDDVSGRHVLDSVCAKIGKVTRKFHFTNVVGFEIDTED